jgi:hypothetical protein
LDTPLIVVRLAKGIGKIVENSETQSNCNKNQFKQRVSGSPGPPELAIVGIAIMT